MTHLLGILYPKMRVTAENIIIDTEIVPYMIDNQTEQINDAVNAVAGGVASVETGIILAGLTDKIQEEKELLKAKESKNIFEPTE